MLKRLIYKLVELIRGKPDFNTGEIIALSFKNDNYWMVN